MCKADENGIVLEVFLDVNVRLRTNSHLSGVRLIANYCILSREVDVNAVSQLCKATASLCVLLVEYNKIKSVYSPRWK